MKLLYKSLLLSTGMCLALSSCNDLDTDLYGENVTGETKEEVLDVDPEMAQASVNAIATGAYMNMTVLSTHQDFGVPSIMLHFDSFGQDFVSGTMGYNWLQQAIYYYFNDNTCDETYLIWYTMYNEISIANTVFNTIPADTEDDILKFYRAQAHCFRAFDYWILAQVYQQNYFGNPDVSLSEFENMPCVPIITEKNLEEVAENGVARSSVKQVYEQIKTDLNEAISLLSSIDITAEEVIDSKPKRFFNLDAAYGMLARVCLTMCDYPGALEAAQNCLAVTNCTPYSISDVSEPTFINIDDNSWLWGQPVAPTDGVVQTGIVNFPSFMGTFNYGYCMYGAWKWINSTLYDYIPDTDVRKGWWLNSEWESPNLSASYVNYLNQYDFTDDPNGTGSAIQAYTQVKFAPYGNMVGTTTNASDIPYFRIEEVYYILYEAMAMSGNPGGALAGLKQFVQTYRNPDYSFNKTDAESIQNEIWMQRRVEFWGEGFVAWFDLKRLGKPVDRLGGSWPADVTFYVEAYGPEFVLCIPRQETQTNKLLPESDNNKSWESPEPIF